ncbi:FKBP-type peptidyl-prolyl cis-trans isomerase [Lewinella sp. IMCC34183]|uniref:FKBP-type peptidyl-prolyl cis-trans isomerase n=1 Tax=Lewinella sp. IMCC34183 TaxID=2248762 RepID=UPI000E26E29F|nr:FKBP-type peptidyl-prolyl cis-trans isomerase [Lewinella sp. IMCC34183]
MLLRFAYLLPVLLLLLAGCKKDNCDEGYASAREFADADTQNTYTELGNTGMLYYISDTGSVAKPTRQDTVTADYTGYFPDGEIFDQTTAARGPATFALQNVIAGWQLGVPLIGRGGSIRLVIPSELAYGARGSIDRSTGEYSICPNTDLVFDIDLIDFN